MIRLTKTQLQPIGVDIGSDSIKMMQLEVRDGALAVHAAARLPMPMEARGSDELRLPVAVDLIRQMLRQNPFSGRRIVAALPRTIVQVKNLRLPMMPPAEVGQAVEFEARTIYPFDTDQAQVRYLHSGEVRQGADAKQEAIVLAAKNEDVDNVLEQLNRCGAIVESLDWEPAAIYRGIERFFRRREDEHEVNVLVDVGLRCSQVIIGKGRDITFYKPIDIGGEKFNEAVSKKLGITLDEAVALRRRLVEGRGTPEVPGQRDPVRQAVFDGTRSVMEELTHEISLCLRYYSVTFRGQRPARLRLLGGEANDPQLLSILNSSLPIPTEPGRLMHSVSLERMKPSDRRGSLCEWSVALGLGLKLTTGLFKGRDGTPREVAARLNREAPVSPQAEVVDLNRAIGRNAPNASAPTPAPATAPLAPAEPANEAAPKPEAIHA